MNTIIISPHHQTQEGARWLPIQRKFIQKHTKEPHTYIPLQIPEKTKHIKALNMCLERLNQVASKGDLIVEMDSDSFPIADNWIQKVRGYLDEGNEFVAVQRLENPYFYKVIAHPCAAFWYHGTEISFHTIRNNPYIEGYENRKWKSLHRTNKRDLHQQLFACYGPDDTKESIIYHHGAGSRCSRVVKDPYFTKGIRLNVHFFRNADLFIKGLI